MPPLEKPRPLPCEDEDRDEPERRFEELRREPESRESVESPPLLLPKSPSEPLLPPERDDRDDREPELRDEDELRPPPLEPDDPLDMLASAKSVPRRITAASTAAAARPLPEQSDII